MRRGGESVNENLFSALFVFFRGQFNRRIWGEPLADYTRCQSGLLS